VNDAVSEDQPRRVATATAVRDAQWELTRQKRPAIGSLKYSVRSADRLRNVGTRPSHHDSQNEHSTKNQGATRASRRRFFEGSADAATVAALTKDSGTTL
jgi:hypothetical protein